MDKQAIINHIKRKIDWYQTKSMELIDLLNDIQKGNSSNGKNNE